MKAAERNPFIEQNGTADRNILLVVIINVALVLIGVYEFVKQLDREPVFYVPIYIYFWLVSVVFIVLGIYGTYRLWRKQRRGWAIVTGIAVYSLFNSLLFWVPYLLSTQGIDIFGFGTFEVPEDVTISVIGYLLINLVQLYLLLQADMRERLQVSSRMLTNTLVIGGVAVVANRLLVYFIDYF